MCVISNDARERTANLFPDVMQATNSLFDETTDKNPVNGAENLQDIMSFTAKEGRELI
jgi:hypothetical protein